MVSTKRRALCSMHDDQYLQTLRHSIVYTHARRTNLYLFYYTQSVRTTDTAQNTQCFDWEEEGGNEVEKGSRRHSINVQCAETVQCDFHHNENKFHSRCWILVHPGVYTLIQLRFYSETSHRRPATTTESRNLLCLCSFNHNNHERERVKCINY